MGEKFDEYKGKTKEKAGEVLNDEELEREGKVDRASGKVKGAAEDVSDKAKEGAESARERINEAMRND